MGLKGVDFGVPYVEIKEFWVFGLFQKAPTSKVEKITTQVSFYKSKTKSRINGESL